MWLLIYPAAFYRLYKQPTPIYTANKVDDFWKCRSYFMHKFNLDINHGLSAANFTVTFSCYIHISRYLIHTHHNYWRCTLFWKVYSHLNTVWISIEMCHIKVFLYHSKQSGHALFPKASSIFILFISLTINHFSLTLLYTQCWILEVMPPLSAVCSDCARILKLFPNIKWGRRLGCWDSL